MVERRKAQSPWIDFTWKPVAVLAGAAGRGAMDHAVAEDGETTTFYAGAAEIALYRTETGQLSRQSRLGRAHALGGAAADAASSRRTRSLP